MRPTVWQTLAAQATIAFLITASPAGAKLPQPDLRPGSPQARLLQAFRPIGGVGNNPFDPALNAVPGSPELHIAPLTFAPGTKNGLVSGPNPRTISNFIAGGTGAQGQNGETTDPVGSAWMYVFGQFVDHDLGLEETLPTAPAINVTIPAGDPIYPPGTIVPMTRDTRDPRSDTIVNTVAGYLDLSQLYGSTTARAAAVQNPDGTLATSDNGLALPVVDDSFFTGDPRVSENPELTATTILFMREHNYWVATLKVQNPDWTPYQLYNMARAITTAEYQNIVYTQYLPLLLGPVVGPYPGYMPWVSAQVTQEFSTAAFRLHTQVSDTEEGIDNSGNVIFTESLAQAFFNTPEVDEANGIDPLLRSLGVDYAQAMDVYVVSVLRNNLDAALVGGDVDVIDLISIDVQRERDAGLATLNGTRQAMGMPPYRSFAQLTPDPILQKNLAAVYGNINSVDLFIGGLAEVHAFGAEVGPTFQAIIADQFFRLRAGDGFFWHIEVLDPQKASTIAGTTLATLMLRNTATPSLQANLFVESPYPIPAHVKRHVTAPRRLPKGLRPKPLV